MKYDKCTNCIHRYGTRCNKRTMEINSRFIRAWGCDNYKPNYESLLKENIKK